MNMMRGLAVLSSVVALVAGATLSAQPEATSRLLMSDQIIGTGIHNPQGDKIGSIEQFIMDPVSGQAKYAVVDVGGILGFREREIAVPWELITVVDKNTLRMDLSQEQLKRAPVFDEAEWKAMTDRSDWEGQIRKYFEDVKKTS